MDGKPQRERPLNTGWRGRVKLVGERDEFFRLVAEEVVKWEAARRGGVYYRTAKCWMVEQRKLDAEAAREMIKEISSRYLCVAQRVVIADRWRAGVSMRRIAGELGCSASTVSQDIRRNQQSDGPCHPFAAQQRAVARRTRPKPREILADAQLRRWVQDGLGQRWNPQQTSRWLCRHHPDRPEWHVTHEVICQTPLCQAKGGLRRDIEGWSRSGRAVRRSHTSPDARWQRMATEMVMISQGPGRGGCVGTARTEGVDTVVGRCSLGDHVTGTVRVTLP